MVRRERDLSRLRHLIQRALDGELTRLEEEELERLLLAEPEVRRDLAAWRRVEAGMRAPAPKLRDVDQMAREILSRARTEPRPVRRPRPAVAVYALALLGLAVVSFVGSSREPSVPSVSKTSSPVVVRTPRTEDRPPVEVRLGEIAGARVEPNLVRIRF
jgi:anti-sigma factor RsiW